MSQQIKSQKHQKLLLIEDDTTIARIYQEYLHNEPLEITHSETGSSALDHFKTDQPDIVILDLHLPDIPGSKILKTIHKQHPNCPIIVITAHGSIDTAVKAMQTGASDFLLKPFTSERLILIIRRIMECHPSNHPIKTPQQDHYHHKFCNFIGTSPAMQTLYQKIQRAGNSKAAIFITGESGTGKELTAEAIHQLSPRQTKPFIALNCGAIPDNLIESEIFGHVKGAFTSALENRSGAAIEADGGTLFLDELCEMNHALQVKLLRFIQTGTFRRVGSDKIETVDVRFICATNRNPWKEVEEGRFRADLYYRLNVIPLNIPPLNQRGEDVIQLATHYMKKYANEEGVIFTNFSDEAKDALLAHHWPGNVRELQNIIRNALVLNDGPTLTRSMLTFTAKSEAKNQALMPANTPQLTNPLTPEIKPLWRAEHDMIRSALNRYDGNVQKAAEILEVSPSTLYRRLKELSEPTKRT